MTPDEPPSAKSGRPPIRIINRQRLAPSGRKVLGPVLNQILDDRNVPAGLTIDINLVRDAIVHTLNRTYRGKDMPTDVLAFPYLHPREWSGGKRPDHSGASSIFEEETLIGEVLISTDQAKKQAERRGKNIERSIARLAIHGVLHLLGYDHDKPGTTEEMRRMERRYLRLWSRANEGELR